MPQIKIYSTQTCPYCVMLKSYLQSKKVKFEEVMVDAVPGGAQELMNECGSLGVPCTKITFDDGRVEKILGFDKQKFDEVLSL